MVPLPKISLPLVLVASIASGALTAGMAVGSSKDKLEQQAADIVELKSHDRDANGDIRELKADVKEILRLVQGTR